MQAVGTVGPRAGQLAAASKAERRAVRSRRPGGAPGCARPPARRSAGLGRGRQQGGAPGYALPRARRSAGLSAAPSGAERRAERGRRGAGLSVACPRGEAPG